MKKKNMHPLYIHVGFMKTATKTLQNQVFSKIEGAYNIGLPYQDKESKIILNHLSNANCLNYDEEKVRAYFEKVMLAKPKEKTLTILSFENLVRSRDNDIEVIARRLKAIFPNAKIIFTIREQKQWLKSLYLHEIDNNGFSNPLPPFKRWLVKHMNLAFKDRKYNQFSAIEEANFSYITEIYENVFGDNAISIILFEENVNFPEKAAERLSGILSIEYEMLLNYFKNIKKENDKIKKGFLIFNHLNYFLLTSAIREYLFSPRVIKKLRKLFKWGKSANVNYPQWVEEQLDKIYASGNTRIMKKYNIPLENFGYSIQALKKSNR